MRHWGQVFVIVIIAVILAMFAATPPNPQKGDAPSDFFSSARAMVDVEIISDKPHPTGSTENEKVRAFLTQRLENLGLSVTIQQGPLEGRYLERLNRWSGRDKTQQIITNVIGILPGQKPDNKALLLMAHHDTVWGSPGAADDTIGVASIIEIIRAVSDIKRERDIIVLFTDAEELGLVGAKLFFNSHPLRDTIGAVINFEARGGGGTANLFQTSGGNAEAVEVFAKAVKQPSVSSLSTFVYDVLPNDTDMTPALKKDYIAYNIANIGKAQYYHSPKITPQALSKRTLQHMGSQGLDLTRALISRSKLPTRTTNATFFDVFGFFTIIYAPFWGWLILLAATCFYAASLKHIRPLKPIAISAMKMLGFIVVGGIALFVLNWLSGSNDDADYYDRLAAITKLEWAVLFLSIAIFVVFLTETKMKTPQESAQSRFGLALPLLVIGIIGQALAPTATYFISIALLLGGIVAFNAYRLGDRSMNTFSVTLAAAMVLGYMLYLGHYLMLGVGPDMPFVVILPAALAAMIIAKLCPLLTPSKQKLISFAFLELSVGLALFIRFDPVASTVPLY